MRGEQLDRGQQREALVAAGLVDEGVGEPALREEVELRTARWRRGQGRDASGMILSSDEEHSNNSQAS